jgi:hypothetical protein
VRLSTKDEEKMTVYRLDLNHPWPDNTALGGFFLVLTNFILFLGIFVVTRIGKWGTAGVLIYLMLTSSAYHACRAGFVCFTRFRDTQILDHLAVYAALLWVSSHCIVKQEWFTRDQLRRQPTVVVEGAALLYFLMLLPVAMFVVNNPESAWTNVVGFGLPVSLVILSSMITGAPVFYHPYYGWIGLALFGSAVVPYALCPKEWYDYAHSVWHVLSMIAIPFISVACDYRWKLIDEKRELAKLATGVKEPHTADYSHVVDEKQKRAKEDTPFVEDLFFSALNKR